MIKILIGGSPCTYWSIGQSTDNRESRAEGLGWELFKNYLIAKEKFKPDFFLYENNKSASKAIKDQIERELGEDLMYINSNLVSAQNRERFYVFNWKVSQPEDRGIKLKDILDSGYTYQDKSFCLTANYGKTPYPADLLKSVRSQVFELGEVGYHTGYEVKKETVKIGGYKRKANDLLKVPGISDGIYSIRKFSAAEMCRLQTMPDNYVDCVSWTKGATALGNGWTAEVIIHILNGALANVPRDEEIVVLSMYDGIGTGRYCLDKMGFKNIEYFAYEIDKSAIEIAKTNYPDIIEKGDAFRLREDNWELESIFLI